MTRINGKNFLIYVEQERGEIHPVTFELIGEARKMAVKVGYQVNCVIVGGKGTKENAEKLLPYGVDNVYVYEHEASKASAQTVIQTQLQTVSQQTNQALC